jgi:hypothetical protein
MVTLKNVLDCQPYTVSTGTRCSIRPDIWTVNFDIWLVKLRWYPVGSLISGLGIRCNIYNLDYLFRWDL